MVSQSASASRWRSGNNIMKTTASVLVLAFAFTASWALYLAGEPVAQAPQPHAKETTLRNIRQLTSGGENAEAYFSADGKQLIFQSTRAPYQCDQIFTMNVDGSSVRMVSTGTGRTTCGYFTPDGSRIIYASTHLGGPECPPVPDASLGYVWPLYKTFDIFSAKADGTDIRRLTSTVAYDAEGTVSPDGRKIIFT